MFNKRFWRLTVRPWSSSPRSFISRRWISWRASTSALLSSIFFCSLCFKRSRLNTSSVIECTVLTLYFSSHDVKFGCRCPTLVYEWLNIVSKANELWTGGCTIWVQVKYVLILLSQIFWQNMHLENVRNLCLYRLKIVNKSPYWPTKSRSIQCARNWECNALSLTAFLLDVMQFWIFKDVNKTTCTSVANYWTRIIFWSYQLSNATSLLAYSLPLARGLPPTQSLLSL